MTDSPVPLRPATPEEIAHALAFSLQFNGRKRVHHADDTMAWITAQRLVQHLEQSGFVVMKKPPDPPHTTSWMPSTKAGHDD